MTRELVVRRDNPLPMEVQRGGMMSVIDSVLSDADETVQQALSMLGDKSGSVNVRERIVIYVEED